MISVASSIKFRKVDGLLPSFNNTFLSEEVRPGIFKRDFHQIVYSTDEITIQVKALTGYTFDIEYSEDCWKAWTKYKDGPLEVTGPTFDYLETLIEFSDFSCSTIQFKIKISDGIGGTELWISEPIKILSEENDNLLLIEYFNNYLENDENLFQVDYSTGITHQLRIYGTCLEYKPGGETSVFDNQEELTKISGEVKRILTLSTEPIPAYLAEMLWAALQHDHFYINEVEYVAEKAPEYENKTGTLASFTTELTQKDIIGLNTHDIGWDVDLITTDDMVIVLQNETASGAVSFSIPAAYKIAWISGIRVAGDPVIKAGRAPGGDDILFSMNLNATDNIYEVASIGTKMNATDLAANLYITVSGVGAVADIRVTLVKDIPA